MPLFLVETMQLCRFKYVVDAKSLSHAYDTVVMKEVQNEFSQMHLDEQIVTGRAITEDEFEKMNIALEEYGDGTRGQPETGSPWLGKQIIHVVDYT